MKVLKDGFLHLAEDLDLLLGSIRKPRLQGEIIPVPDPGGGRGGPPGPVKIGHKKDGRRRRPHRFHVSRPPPYPAAGSATESTDKCWIWSMRDSAVFTVRTFC